jgi:hypothetical protein
MHPVCARHDGSKAFLLAEIMEGEKTYSPAEFFFAFIHSDLKALARQSRL